MGQVGGRDFLSFKDEGTRFRNATSKQVVGLLLRSSGKAGEPLPAEEHEMDYSRVINSALPPEIRVLGWTTAPTDFNARLEGFKVKDLGVEKKHFHQS